LLVDYPLVLLRIFVYVGVVPVTPGRTTLLRVNARCSVFMPRAGVVPLLHTFVQGSFGSRCCARCAACVCGVRATLLLYRTARRPRCAVARLGVSFALGAAFARTDVVYRILRIDYASVTLATIAPAVTIRERRCHVLPAYRHHGVYSTAVSAFMTCHRESTARLLLMPSDCRPGTFGC